MLKIIITSIFITAVVGFGAGVRVGPSQPHVSAESNYNYALDVSTPWADTGISCLRWNGGHSDDIRRCNMVPRLGPLIDADGQGFPQGWGECNYHSLVAWVGVTQPAVLSFPA